jgi:hypothetical protein
MLKIADRWERFILVNRVLHTDAILSQGRGFIALSLALIDASCNPIAPGRFRLGRMS